MIACVMLYYTYDSACQDRGPVSRIQSQLLARQDR